MALIGRHRWEKVVEIEQLSHTVNEIKEWGQGHKLAFSNFLLSVPGVVVALVGPVEGTALTAVSTGSDRTHSQTDSTELTGPGYCRLPHPTPLEIQRRQTFFFL